MVDPTRSSETDPGRHGSEAGCCGVHRWKFSRWFGRISFETLDRRGHVLGSATLQFGSEVSQSLIDQWLPRKSQIAMVEMFATVVALETFREVQNSFSLLFVDSESVQGALVKVIFLEISS